MKKVYVDESNQATITCPKCGFEKSLDVIAFKNTKKRIKVKCKCGETHQITIEFRRQYRKNVSISGEYIDKIKGKRGEIIIRDLSLFGILFESLGTHPISVDDILEVKFKLDNPMRSEICKRVKVKWIKDRMVGAQSVGKKIYEKALGFYLKT